MIETDPTPVPPESSGTPDVQRHTGWVRPLLDGLASGRLALVLIAALMLFAVAGAMLPQEGLMTPAELLAWQDRNPIVSDYADAFGLFHVFHCWPFLITIILLSANTLTCMVLTLHNKGWIAGLTGWMAVRRVGFVTLHLSLLLLFAGGFLSASADLDGKIILIEGQEFTDWPGNYLELQEGPLRSKQHTGMRIRLQDVDIEYEQDKYIVGVKSKLEVLEDDRVVATGTIEVNKPFTHRGLSFTRDENGFAPRLAIRHTARDMALGDTFVALQAKRIADGHEFKDVLPLPYSTQRLVVTLYPSFVRKDGVFRKLNDLPDDPLLLLEVESQSGEIVERAQVKLNDEVQIGQYTLAFPELRRWASFRVGHDPGYPLVCAALWIGLVAMLMRYAGEVRSWLREWSEPSCEEQKSSTAAHLLPGVASQVMMRADSCGEAVP